MKNFNMGKIIALVIAIIFICSVFTACGNDDDGGKTFGDGNNGASDGVKDENSSSGLHGDNSGADTAGPSKEDLKDNIPELDFDGHEFKILNTDQQDLYYMNLIMEPYEYADTGDIINDAAYRRSIEIQERFNCTIKEVIVTNGSRDGAFKKSALAGDNAYDISCIDNNEAFKHASDGLVYDINELVGFAYAKFDGK